MGRQHLNQITAFYAENFKAINKGTWFELNDLNILTGANNSGKSTLFKAMKIFTEGFVNGDFPVIDLQKVLPESGYFSDLLNFNSKQKHFKVGFRFFSAHFNSQFEIIYQFVEGEHPSEARFASVQVKNNSKLLIKLYHCDVILYDEENKIDIEKISFKSVLENSNPGQIIFSINLQMLRLLLPTEKYAEHEGVFEILERQFGEEWVGELLIEEKFSDNNLVPYSRISEELFFDLFTDYYCNLYNYDNKYPIFNDSDGEEVECEYRKKCSEIVYQDFIKDYFNQLFNEISSQIRFFYIKRLYHIELKDTFYSRIIPISNLNFKVLVSGYDEYKEKQVLNIYSKYNIKPLLPDNEINNPSDKVSLGMLVLRDYYYVNFWLRVFGFEGYIITEELDNQAYKVFYYDARSNRKINIADLGKGHAQLIQFLLALAYKILIQRDNDPKKSKYEQRQTIIHLEEPEAFMHPAWQSKLADLMVLLSNHHGVQFLIETHSVYLIQKLQLLVAQGKIEPDKISLLYFENVKKGIEFRRINIRKDGMLREGFGPGFYDESAMLAIDLLNAQHEN